MRRIKIPWRLWVGAVFAFGLLNAAFFALDLPTRLLGVRGNIIAGAAVAVA